MSTALYNVTGSVATVTLDAPERRNALSPLLMTQLMADLDAAEADAAVRSVVLTHTGPVFCSGMDLTKVADDPAGNQPIMALPVLLQRIMEFSKPVIARINGKARAGGIGLIAASDIAIAVPEADFAFSEVRIGLIPAVISVAVLPRLLPRAALELCLTGERFGAARAKEIGLINSVAADIDAEVARFVEMFQLCEPTALAGTKAMLQRDRSVSVIEDFAEMERLSTSYFASAAAQEGIAAFAAKRAPSWAE